MIDHLFRHQYGKMVAILTRIFGLEHLDTIEDAVQDTFINAMRAWQGSWPDNPEAWLTTASKNRVLDLLRKISAEDHRIAKMESGVESIAIHQLFLDHEVKDSLLRMIFTACHPALKPKDQIAFALKVVSGFSGKEIATALLLKPESVKKSLVRARKVIQEQQVVFEIPNQSNLKIRLYRVLEVVYLIFNEGFHSHRKEVLVREDLCGEAIRLAKNLLENPYTATPDSYALLAMFCFQSARLRSKLNGQLEVISLKDQDRSQWHEPLIVLGNEYMDKAASAGVFGLYHYEAAIAGAHATASCYEKTDWDKVLFWYQQLYQLEPSPFNLLNQAVVQLERKQFQSVLILLDTIKPKSLEQRSYLYHGTYAEYGYRIGDKPLTLEHIETALVLVNNDAERSFLQKKKQHYLEESKML